MPASNQPASTAPGAASEEGKRRRSGARNASSDSEREMAAPPASLSATHIGPSPVSTCPKRMACIDASYGRRVIRSAGNPVLPSATDDHEVEGTVPLLVLREEPGAGPQAHRGA